MNKSVLFLSLWIVQAWALSCSAPVTLSEPAGLYFLPRATLNDKGDALVAWYTLTPGESVSVQVATCDSEKRWSKAEQLGEFEEKVGTARLHMTNEGDAFVSWWCKKDKEQSYKFSKKTGGSWCPAMTVSSSDDFNTILAADFDNEGNPIVLGFKINQETPQFGVIHYHHATDSKNSKVLSTNAEIIPFRIVRSPQGHTSVLQLMPHKNWYFRTSDYDIQQLKLKEGEWVAPITLCKLGMTDIQEEHIAHLIPSMNSKGNMALIWLDWHDKSKGTKVVAAPENSKGSSIVLATSKAGFDSPKILIDEQDNILAVWIGLHKHRNAIFAAYKPQGQPWTSPIPLSHSQNHVDQFELSQDHQGHFVVVWSEQSFDVKSLIYGAVFSTQKQECSSILLSPEDQLCGEPSIAFNQKGEGIITWSTLVLDKKQYVIQAAELKMD